MRTNLPKILARQRVNRAVNGTAIKLTWTETAGGTVDPLTKSVVGGTVTLRSETVKAFVHAVQIATSAVQQFNEFENGDLILDLAPDVVLEGRDGLTFTLPNGEAWVAKKIGDRLGRTWDATVQGKQLYRSVLLRKAT